MPSDNISYIAMYVIAVYIVVQYILINNNRDAVISVVMYLLAKLKPSEQKEHFSQEEQNGLGGI